MKSASLFLAGFLFFTMFASTADAKRFRFFPGFSGGGETIDLVYDLPNQPPFVRDGKAFNVGYLNSRKGNAYVLYHGNGYIKLGEREIAALRAVLGFDPTARHRAQHAGTTPIPDKAPAADDEALDLHPGASTQDILKDRTPIWIVMIPLILIASILLVFILRGSRGLSKLAGPLTRLVSGKEDATQTAYAALDARMTERLNKMQPDIAQPAYHGHGTWHFSSAPSPAANAPVRSFGRRNA
jgi:hypothetical protein